MKKINKENNGDIILKPVDWLNLPYLNLPPVDERMIGFVISLKTTGLDAEKDEIINLSYIKFIMTQNGEVVEILKEKEMYQEPKAPLTEQVKELTFLSDEDLSGHLINWNEVEEDLSNADVVISFNAQFERPFLEKMINPHHKKWSCAYSQIPWASFGYPKRSLELLCMYHNFYYEEIPGVEKCKGLINLLQKFSPGEHKLYLKILLETLSEKSFLVIGLKSQYENKWFFNQYKFSFNKHLNMWFKFYDEKNKTEAQTVLDEMKHAIYEGIPFHGCMVEIDATKKFKSLGEFAGLSGNEKIFTKEPPGKYTKPFMLIARNLDMSHSSILESRLYSWTSNGNKHEWVIYVTQEEANNEKKWLVDNLYISHFKGSLVPNKDYQPPAPEIST